MGHTMAVTYGPQTNKVWFKMLVIELHQNFFYILTFPRISILQKKTLHHAKLFSFTRLNLLINRRVSVTLGKEAGEWAGEEEG